MLLQRGMMAKTTKEAIHRNYPLRRRIFKRMSCIYICREPYVHMWLIPICGPVKPFLVSANTCLLVHGCRFGWKLPHKYAGKWLRVKKIKYVNAKPCLFALDEDPQTHTRTSTSFSKANVILSWVVFQMVKQFPTKQLTGFTTYQHHCWLISCSASMIVHMVVLVQVDFLLAITTNLQPESRKLTALLDKSTHSKQNVFVEFTRHWHIAHVHTFQAFYGVN